MWPRWHPTAEAAPMPNAQSDQKPPVPALSIVIVNWNTRDLLLALLARLLPNPPIACEVLVVDNLSSDGSAAAAQQTFPAAIVLPQPRNGGFAYGVNRGLERAGGDWILLLNTDAEAAWPELLAVMAAAAREPDAAVFGPKIVDEHGRPQASTWPRHLPRHYLPHAVGLGRFFETPPPTAAADVDCVSGCVFLIRGQPCPQSEASTSASSCISKRRTSVSAWRLRRDRISPAKARANICRARHARAARRCRSAGDRHRRGGGHRRQTCRRR